MKLLFITPQINEDHDDLAFASQWVQGFIDQGFDVEVICSKLGRTQLRCPIHVMMDGTARSRLAIWWRFIRCIRTCSYDAVFVHLGQRWLGAGALYWLVKRIPVYLWYTHYTNPLSLKIGMLCVKNAFCATKDSLPHYTHDPRKVVTGHGIDTQFWKSATRVVDGLRPPTDLLAVHRLSRSKRLELIIQALAYLPEAYTLTHYGREQDPINDAGYRDELQALIARLGMQQRVTFCGSVPMPQLREVYPQFQVLVNFAPKTIDKTALEDMYAGLTPVITASQAQAIGHISYPASDDPKVIAEYILHMQIQPREQMTRMVEEHHSLRALIQTMTAYIRGK